MVVGCAQEESDPGAFYTIDPAFNSFYSAFDAAYNTKIYMPIAFVAQASPIVGRCVVYDDGHRQIEIDPIYWPTITPDMQTVLIYHELGHCVFNRAHNWDTFSDGCPLSIMQYTNFGDPCYLSHQSQYMAELPHSEPGDHL